MQTVLSRQWFERGLNAYLLLIGAVTLAYGLISARIARSWVLADWLINYTGGFVRRGLTGEIALLLARLLHVPVAGVGVVFYLAPYAVLLFAVRGLAQKAGPSWWVVALLVSPATLAFQVLDATGGFRKETLYLAALAVLLAGLQRRTIGPVAMSAGMALLLGAMVLSHESLICYAPYLFAALLIAGRTFRQACGQFALAVLVGGVAALECSRHLGNVAIASSICASLGYVLKPEGSPMCSGAIYYLTYSRAMAMEDTRELMEGADYLRTYSYGLLLAVLPLVGGTLALRGFRRELRAIWGAAAVSVLGSLPLFFYALDWGRWIYIHVFSVGLLLLLVEGGRAKVGDVAIALGARRRMMLGGLVAYAILWTLPHIPMLTPRYGYVGLVEYAMHYRDGHRGAL